MLGHNSSWVPHGSACLMTALYRHFLYVCRANGLGRERVKAQGRFDSWPGWWLGRFASSRFIRLGIPKPRFLGCDTSDIHLGCSAWPVGPGEQEACWEHRTRAAWCATSNKAFCLWSRSLVFSAWQFYGQKLLCLSSFHILKFIFRFYLINSNFCIWLIVIRKGAKIQFFSLQTHTQKSLYFLLSIFVYL